MLCILMFTFGKKEQEGCEDEVGRGDKERGGGEE